MGSKELLLVRGTNGSGKSTLVRCLAGLLRPQSGTIEFVDHGFVCDTEERRSRVGWVGPDLSFYESLSALENLQFFGRLKGLRPEVGRRLLDRLGVPSTRLASALSSGMKQRLRWAFALQHHPSLLLLDEPFQNLDAEGETSTLELLSEHLADGGIAAVASPVALSLHAHQTLELESTPIQGVAGSAA